MSDPPPPEPSPGRDLALGAALVLPTGFLELRLEAALAGVFAAGAAARAADAFLVTAVVEELARFLAVRFAARRLTDPAARAWTGARIGLGLALFEGVFYLASPAAALLRVALSTPSHVLDGWIMGAGFGRPAATLLACIVLHGLWDFGAFMVQDGAVWWGLVIPLVLGAQLTLAQRVGADSGAGFPGLPADSGFRKAVRGLGSLFLGLALVAIPGAMEEGAGAPAFPHLVVGAGFFAAIGMLGLVLGRPAPAR